MTDERIPLVDLRGELATIRPEIDAAIAGVLDSGQFIMGDMVREFENELRQYLGVGGVLGVSSGSDALVIALRALGIGDGDEVITTAFTFAATATAILRVGATPVFVDIDPPGFNMGVGWLREAVTDRTKAVLVVHLYGAPVDMKVLTTAAHDLNLLVIEDVAQGLSGHVNGNKLGTLGDASAFSFFPSKNLGAYGDAGAVWLADPKAAAIARMLRVHGAKQKYENEILGYNARLDELQAAILRVKLRHLDRGAARCTAAAARYNDLIGTSALCPELTPGHAWHQYTIRLPAATRDRVQSYLTHEGIGTAVYYPTPLHELPVFHGCRYVGRSDAASAASKAVLSLPMWPGITDEQQARVVQVLQEAVVGVRGYPSTGTPFASEGPTALRKAELPQDMGPHVHSTAYVHPTATVDDGAEVGQRTKVWHGCHVMAGAEVGADCSLGQNVFVADGVQIADRVKIQNNVSVYSGVILEDDVFLGPSCVFTNVKNPRSEIDRKAEYKPTHVGRGATIGANATIVCGVTIGQYAFVGAGAVVTKDVRDYELAVGNPAKQVAWMSRHGHRMDHAGPLVPLVCPESGWRYAMDGVDGDLRLRCLDHAEDQPLPRAKGDEDRG